jgi:hypothetical protein
MTETMSLEFAQKVICQSKMQQFAVNTARKLRSSGRYMSVPYSMYEQGPLLCLYGEKTCTPCIAQSNL